MKIEHVAIWSKDIDVLKDFYVKYFSTTSNAKYSRDNRGFESYFITFDTGSRLELMQKPKLLPNSTDVDITSGFVHIAISVGEMQEVVDLTAMLEKDGYTIKSYPRYTGDGYFESVVLDPDGNLVEITMD